MPLYTRRGDQGMTSLLGGKKISKSDLLVEILGTIDEANAVLGIARSVCKAASSWDLIYKVQKDLFVLMADIASALEDAETQRSLVEEAHVLWIENQINGLIKAEDMPLNFLIPGDTYAAGVLDFARTIIRRAERRMVAFHESNSFHNPCVLKYLNRLSSLCFALELQELKLLGDE